MKIKDLKAFANKSELELSKVLNDKRADLEKVQLDMAAGKEKNLKKGKNLRHEIAQIMTLIKQKSLIEAEKSKNKV